jgi:alanine racemase
LNAAVRPARATIDLDALRHNLRLARRRSPAARVWAVVKANAYGHGLQRAVQAFQAADGLALLEIDEAARLRESGWTGPLLLLEGFFDATDLPVFAAHRFTAVVHDAGQVAMIERAKLAAPLDVYLKINTGMNRLGFRPARAHEMLERLRASGNTASVTLMTHFADADGPRGVAEPLAAMEEASRGLALPRSCANSAALLRFPQTHFDWVRPGIMLYGCSPFPDESAGSIGLRPAMTLRSALIGVQTLAAGERVGYSGLFEAERETRVGVVALGYADGYPRHAPVGTPVLVAGRRTRTVGRVSMDLMFVDLTDVPAAGPGTEVTLWGEGLSADEVAAAAGTVSYELLCALSPRVPVHVIGGEAGGEGAIGKG